MLYYCFKNYEEFKEIFGIIEHGNGVKSRKNKILLSLYKDKAAFHTHVRNLEYRSLDDMYWSCVRRLDGLKSGSKKYDKLCEFKFGIRERRRMFDLSEKLDSLLIYTTLSTLKSELMRILSSYDFTVPGAHNELNLNRRLYYSDSFKTDSLDGLCEDGTLNAIRYYNIEKERVFKMKAGRMFEHIMSCNRITNKLPLPIKRWLTEEFVADWVEYARQSVGDSEYTLHVDDNFKDIYSRERCAGYDTDSDSFGSCMTGRGHWAFYRDAVKAKAAYLTDEDGMIVARCIVFTEVFDQDGKVWRLAERQYSKFCDQTLQRQLVMALIRDGHIDGHKKVGASCHDARAFIDINGNSLEDRKFRIKCNLNDGDTLSYQDTFKYYDEDDHIADNYGGGSEALDSTDDTWGSSREQEYSDYNDEWIDRDDAEYVETRSDWFYYNQTVVAGVYDRYNDRYNTERCFEDDCIEIDGNYYYAGENANCPEDYNIIDCPVCGDYFIPDRGYACYSDYTETDYCCSDCLAKAERDYHIDNGHAYSQYDDAWYDADEVITAKRWRRLMFDMSHYEEITISIETFNSLVEDFEATEFCGDYYIDDVKYDGEPLHLSHDEKIVA